MAKGRAGFMLEAWKFGVYLTLPVFASVYYSDPQRQKDTVEYWKFIKAPPPTTITFKEELELHMKQQKQREAYQEQLKLLSQQAKQVEIATAQETDSSTSTSSGTRWRWLRWIGLGGTNS